MRRRRRTGTFVVLLVAALGLALAGTTAAHVRKASGPYVVELGWVDEPAYSGARNAVEVRVEDRAGRPVTDPRASLSVEVAFGETRRDLTLAPAGAPGSFTAAIVPTRPGSYGLHVTGTLRGRGVDVAATCSERTFDCVQGADAIQFPVAEPSGSELDRKLDRALLRTQRAEDDAAHAQTLAIAAIAAALLALLAALGVGLRAARRR